MSVQFVLRNNGNSVIWIQYFWSKFSKLDYIKILCLTLSLYRYIVVKKYKVLKDTIFAILLHFWFCEECRHFKTIATSNLKFIQYLLICIQNKILIFCSHKWVSFWKTWFLKVFLENGYILFLMPEKFLIRIL